eukprot:2994068-Pyramimonas_sp.AAC.1
MRGAEGLAARRVISAFQKLKKDGSWRRFTAASIEGGTQVSIFVGLDKSPQVIRREIQTKRLLEFVRDAGVEGRWRVNRHAG